MNEVVEHSAVQAHHDDGPMSAEQIHAQVQLIQRVMLTEMQDGVHYGTIPGCGDKPALLKAGAEKLCMTFRLAPKYDIEDLGIDGERRYLIRAKLYTIKHGLFLGEGVGEASTQEEKYAWQKASDVEYDEQLDLSRRRVKHYGSADQKQVRANISDRSNTVLKMGKKRALVDAVLTVTAASDMFSQDLDEDDVAKMTRDSQPEEKQKPKAKEQPAPIIPYGKWKVDENGQPRKITDPAIPTEYLQWMADKTAAQLQDPAREKFRASYTLFVAALDGEIAKRKASQPKPVEEPSQTPQNPSQAGPGDVKTPTQGDKPSQGEEPARKPFTEKGWAEFVLYAEEEAHAEYADAKKTFKVASGHDLPKEKRIAFFDMVNGLVEANKK